MTVQEMIGVVVSRTVMMSDGEKETTVVIAALLITWGVALTTLYIKLGR